MSRQRLLPGVEIEKGVARMTAYEVTYTIAICPACGKAEVEVGDADVAVRSGRNYPSCCHAGGGVFVQRRLVARRRMTLELTGDPAPADPTCEVALASAPAAPDPAQEAAQRRLVELEQENAALRQQLAEVEARLEEVNAYGRGVK